MDKDQAVMDPAAMDDAGLAAALEKGDDLGKPEVPDPAKTAADDQKTDVQPKEGAEGSTDKDKPAEGEGKKDAEGAAAVQPNPIEERISKLEKQVQDKEAFIQRQARELGELRARERAKEIARAREDVKELEDPAEISRRSADLDRLERSEKKDEVARVIPDFDSLIDTMVEIAKADGESDEVIAAFKADPFVPPTSFLTTFAARARTHKAAMAREAALKAEIEEAKKKADEIAKRIESAAKGAPAVMTGKDGGKSKVETDKWSRLTPDSVAGLSDAELDEFLASASGE